MTREDYIPRLLLGRMKKERQIVALFDEELGLYPSRR